MKRIGLFLDTINLYNTLKYKYGSDARLSYAKYLEFFDYDYSSKKAVCLDGEKSKPFHDALGNLGFDLIKQPLKKYINYHSGYKGTKVESDIALAVALLNSDHDHYIIGTNNDDLWPVLELLRHRGKTITITGAGLGTLPCTHSIEIPSSLLEE